MCFQQHASYEVVSTIFQTVIVVTVSVKDRREGHDHTSAMYFLVTEDLAVNSNDSGYDL
jgi:hypothetical protein